MPSAHSSPIGREAVTGVILAGGRGRRMGGIDKGLTLLRGKPLATHVIEALRPQVAAVVVSANRNLAHYRALGARVVEDRRGGHLGPLAGVASALHITRTPYALIVPCDVPRIPADLRALLADALLGAGARACAAHDGTRIHPTVCLLERELAASADDAVEAGHLKMEAWLREQGAATADLSDRAFALANVNTREDLERLQDEIVREAGSC